jgi:hypothetical protein
LFFLFFKKKKAKIFRQAEQTRNTLAQELTENFNKRKAEINAELASAAVSDEVLTLQQREADLATITSALNTTNANITGVYPNLPTTPLLYPLILKKNRRKKN